MSEHLIWQVGNRSPSITEDIVDSTGAAVNLTGSTVQFRMRPVGSSTLKVDQPATIVSAPLGQVRYDWAAIDVDTDGDYLVWWVVTSGGKTQDVSEALIEFRAHGPDARTYVELEEFKSTSELTGTSFADDDIRSALVSASRAVDSECGRRFYLDADATQARYYNADYCRRKLLIDDLVALTSFQTDTDGDGTYDATWVLNTDFVLEPKNGPADGRPYTRIQILPRSNYRFPNASYYPNAVKLTGQFGWAAVPENIKLATRLIAARLLKLSREAPFGVVGLGADGSAVRISRSIPDVDLLLSPYRRTRLLV